MNNEDSVIKKAMGNGADGYFLKRQIGKSLTMHLTL
jgi:hypothetical protein